MTVIPSRIARSTGKLVLAAALASASAIAHADEFGLLGGQGRSSEVGGLDRAWMVDYQQNFGRIFALGVSYNNEGHADNNHRDGAAVQLRGRFRLIDSKLILTVGAGPYAFFNTTRAGPNASDSVDHGWGMLYSAGLTWELGNSWYLQGRYQRVEANRSHDGNFLLVGAGYRFGASPDEEEPPAANRDREIGVYGGKVIANTFQSENARALAIDYRRKVTETYDRSLTLLDESDNGPVRRYGIAGQVWAVRELGHERLTVSGGIGPYVLFRARSDDASGATDRIAGLASASLAYDITPKLRARLVIHRVFARHSRDTDVMLLGLSWVS